MSDLISREALINIFEERMHDDNVMCPIIKVLDVLEIVDELPTVEAKEVVHGYIKTVVGKMGVMHQECSACGNILEWKAYPNYCDECGAKLNGADMRTSAE